MNARTPPPPPPTRDTAREEYAEESNRALVLEILKLPGRALPLDDPAWDLLGPADTAYRTAWERYATNRTSRAELDRTRADLLQTWTRVLLPPPESASPL